QYAVVANRLDGVRRARRLVLAAPRQRWRHDTLVGDDRREHEAAHHAPSPSPPAVDFSTSSARAPRTPSRPSRSASSRTSGRATTTTSWSSGRRSASVPKASLSRRFTLLRSTAPPTLRDTDTPRRVPSDASPADARGKL